MAKRNIFVRRNAARNTKAAFYGVPQTAEMPFRLWIGGFLLGPDLDCNAHTLKRKI